MKESGTGGNLAQKVVLQGNSKDKVGKEMTPDALLMDNSEYLLTTTLDKALRNICRSVVDLFIKTRVLTMFGHPIYFMDGPDPSIAISGPHEGF